jgi:hypothetical protein
MDKLNNSLPKKFKELCDYFDNLYHFKNILIVNTNFTGKFLDNFFPDDERITRIKYTPDSYDFFINLINNNSGNTENKFDLICLDPYHEYKESIGSFNILLPLLSENGILISHDCNPPNFESAYYKCKKGIWCGITYATFVEIAYNNPNLYYAVIDNDYGLGIISKNKIDYVKKITDNEKQLHFLNLFYANKYKEAYDYFKGNTVDIINLITENTNIITSHINTNTRYHIKLNIKTLLLFRK